MGRNKLNLQEDEDLAEEVQKYAYLYDKSCKEYKSKTLVENAWKEVEKTLGYEEGEDWIVVNFMSLMFLLPFTADLFYVLIACRGGCKEFSESQKTIQPCSK